MFSVSLHPSLHSECSSHQNQGTWSYVFAFSHLAHLSSRSCPQSQRTWGNTRLSKNASVVPFKDTCRCELFPEEVIIFSLVFKCHSILTLKLALKSEDTKNNLGAPGFSDREPITADASCQALFGAGDKN